MQVTETLAEGLKREYQVVLPLAELDARAIERLSAIKDRVRLDGFRPGKVPLPHLKRVYGRAVMGEVIEQAMSEVNSKIVSDGGFRLAVEPRITLASEGEEAVNKVMEGQADLAYTVALELLPKIELADFKSIRLVRPVAEVIESEIDEAVAKIGEANRPFADKQGKAEKGDRVVVSFHGTVDGKTFEGGSAEEVPIVIGAGQFIPGFEEQLIGVEQGETRTLKVTFPKNYLAERLAGKEAEFEVTVKILAEPTAIAIDDAFAKTLGLDSLAKLKLQVRDRIERGNAAASLARIKRMLLDALDERHKFEVPPSLVEQEFAGIWATLTKEMETQGGSFADEGKTEEETRAEYRQIAERRVRLGLVLAEVGEKNSIAVSDDELTRAALEYARQYRGQEQQAFEQIRRNPTMMATLRAPIFEEKVVDFLLELASVTNKTVSREQLFSDYEHGEDGGGQKDTGKKSRKSGKAAKTGKAGKAGKASKD